MPNKHIAARFGRLADASRWTDRELGDLLHCHHSTIANWKAGRREIPAEILDWLQGVVDYLRDSPPPDYRTIRPASGRPSPE